jgi:hypothetical protein
MIASERSQNIIIVLALSAAIISSGLMVGNAYYYGGTYVLTELLDISLADIQVSNADPDNTTGNPVVSLIFNMRVTARAEGNVRVTFLGAELWLNNDILSLMAFASIPSLADQYLHSDYNRNVTMSQSAGPPDDNQAIWEAYNASTWAWNVTLRYSMIVFDVPGTITWRYLDFYTTDFTLA